MTILDDKRQWRAHQARVKALPHDYQVVYQAISRYWFKVAIAPTYLPNAQALVALLALFEDAAAQHQDVLAVVGDDVAAFADEFAQAAQAKV
ncbi:DUF1048 domain-containing protein [Lacticaseibacillus jixiensis]|uniref:DUF1048 domain-containing protein n=1 Tax=Lacticaseibacillus jixiensis TaxID=3231926 RepID=UPI0036F36686